MLFARHFRASLHVAQRIACSASSPVHRGKLAVAAGAICTSAATHCSSSSSQPTTWTLQYFPVPGGPGEIVRVLLALSGTAWTDERVPGTKWGALKPNTKYGQMPVLTSSDGRVLTQSKAIARYLAKGAKVQGEPLYPEDSWLAYQVDEYVEALEDVRAKFGKTFGIKDPKEKEAARAALFATDGTGEIYEGLKRIEGLVSPGGCMVGTSTTLADAWLFVLVNQFRAGWLDGVPADGWMDHLPKLQAVVAKVAAIPALRAHYEKNADMVVLGKKIHTVFLGHA